MSRIGTKNLDFIPPSQESLYCPPIISRIVKHSGEYPTRVNLTRMQATDVCVDIFGNILIFHIFIVYTFTNKRLWFKNTMHCCPV